MNAFSNASAARTCPAPAEADKIRTLLNIVFRTRIVSSGHDKHESRGRGKGLGKWKFSGSPLSQVRRHVRHCTVAPLMLGSDYFPRLRVFQHPVVFQAHNQKQHVRRCSMKMRLIAATVLLAVCAFAAENDR